jgi:hypothetical protein
MFREVILQRDLASKVPIIPKKATGGKYRYAKTFDLALKATSRPKLLRLDTPHFQCTET